MFSDSFVLINYRTLFSIMTELKLELPVTSLAEYQSVAVISLTGRWPSSAELMGLSAAAARASISTLAKSTVIHAGRCGGGH